MSEVGEDGRVGRGGVIHCDLIVKGNLPRPNVNVDIDGLKLVVVLE